MSRELYDLCRKYRYYYNKLRVLNEADEQVYDEYLKKAVAYTRSDLDEILQDIVNHVLNGVIHPAMINMETPYHSTIHFGEIEIKGCFDKRFMRWLYSNPCRKEYK